MRPKPKAWIFFSIGFAALPLLQQILTTESYALAPATRFSTNQEAQGRGTSQQIKLAWIARLSDSKGRPLAFSELGQRLEAILQQDGQGKLTRLNDGTLVVQFADHALVFRSRQHKRWQMEIAWTQTEKDLLDAYLLVESDATRYSKMIFWSDWPAAARAWGSYMDFQKRHPSLDSSYTRTQAIQDLMLVKFTPGDRLAADEEITVSQLEEALEPYMVNHPDKFIHETDLFRDEDHWETSLLSYLRGLLSALDNKGNRQIRASSYGAANGAEAYTMAAMIATVLDEMADKRGLVGVDRERWMDSWDVRILAIDKSLPHLFNTARGKYRRTQAYKKLTDKYMKRPHFLARKNLILANKRMRSWVQPEMSDLKDPSEVQRLLKEPQHIVFYNQIRYQLALQPDPANRALDSAIAGHPQPLWLYSDGNVCLRLDRHLIESGLFRDDHSVCLKETLCIKDYHARLTAYLDLLYDRLHVWQRFSAFLERLPENSQKLLTQQGRAEIFENLVQEFVLDHYGPKSMAMAHDLRLLLDLDTPRMQHERTETRIAGRRIKPKSDEEWAEGMIENMRIWSLRKARRYERFLKRNSGNIRTRIALAIAYAYASDKNLQPKIWAVLDEGLKMAPGNPDLLECKANLLASLANAHGQAKEILRAILKRDPKRIPALKQLETIYGLEQDTLRALKTSVWILACYPDRRDWKHYTERLRLEFASLGDIPLGDTVMSLANSYPTSEDEALEAMRSLGFKPAPPFSTGFVADEEIQRFTSAAQEVLRQGNWVRAMDLFTDVVMANPKHRAHWTALATGAYRCYMTDTPGNNHHELVASVLVGSVGRLNTAEKCMKREFGPEPFAWPEQDNIAAIAGLYRDKKPEAYQALAHSLKLDATNTQTSLILAKLLLSDARIAEALYVLGHALDNIREPYDWQQALALISAAGHQAKTLDGMQLSSLAGMYADVTPADKDPYTDAVQALQNRMQRVGGQSRTDLGPWDTLFKGREAKDPLLSKDKILSRLEALQDFARDVILPDLIFDEGFWNETDWEEKSRRVKALESRPHTFFISRPELRRRIQSDTHEARTQKELVALLQAPGDDDPAALGAFESLNSKNGIIARMNRLFFGAFGPNAFAEEDNAPTVLAKDPLLMKTIAQKIYARLEKIPKGKTFVVHLWGFGGILEGSEILAREIARLDQERGKRHASQLRYVLSDKEGAMVKMAQAQVSGFPALNDWLGKGILDFRVLDARDPPKDLTDKVDLVISSYLYDSVPQSILIQQNENFYELKARPVLFRSGIPFKKGKQVSWAAFRQMLLKEGLPALGRLEPDAFADIGYEQLLEPVDVPADAPIRKYIREQGGLKPFAVIPMGEACIKALDAALPVLKSDGEIWILDNTVNDYAAMQTDMATFSHHLGNVYASLSRFALAQWAGTRNIGLQIMDEPGWLSEHIGHDVVRIRRLTRMSNQELEEYFPVELLKYNSEIRALAKKGKDFWSAVRPYLPSEFLEQRDFDDQEGKYLEKLQFRIGMALETTRFPWRDMLRENPWLHKGTGGHEPFIRWVESLGFDGPKLIAHMLKHRKTLNEDVVASVIRIKPISHLRRQIAPDPNPISSSL